MNKGKEKEESSKTALSRPITTYKSAFQKDEKILREEVLKTTPVDEQLRADAYELAIKSVSTREYLYPYIPTSTIWVSPVEKKYNHLSAEEVMTFYLKNFTDPFLYPKDFNFYQEILTFTGSVQFESAMRTGGEWAFSKASIIKIITPEQWEGDLYKPKELITNSKNPYRNKLYFNYFDYIKAWELAFSYENRQRKHSWFIQFKTQNTTNFPNWFIVWFSNFGLYPVILPQKIRNIYDEFVRINISMKYHNLHFAALYQVPWIMKWDVIIIPRTLQKFEIKFENIPYLGRRILIKWWDKFEFFKDSIYSQKSLISHETQKIPDSPKRELSNLLKELMASSSKRNLKIQLKAILDSDSDDELMSMSTEPSS